MSAKLRMIVQHGLNVLRAGEKNGLQPALAIHWAQCLSQMVGIHADALFLHLFVQLERLKGISFFFRGVYISGGICMTGSGGFQDVLQGAVQGLLDM